MIINYWFTIQWVPNLAGLILLNHRIHDPIHIRLPSRVIQAVLSHPVLAEVGPAHGAAQIFDTPLINALTMKDMIACGLSNCGIKVEFLEADWAGD